jgi:hypothetical protein
MCQVCMLPGNAETPAVETQERGIDHQVPREISIASLVALILLSLLGCLTIIGLLLGLVVWLQPQFASL